MKLLCITLAIFLSSSGIFAVRPALELDQDLSGTKGDGTDGTLGVRGDAESHGAGDVKVVVEFGGSGVKIIKYKENDVGYWVPDTALGNDGVVKICGVKKPMPPVPWFAESLGDPTEAKAALIKGLETNDLLGKPTTFFVSGGHIKKADASTMTAGAVCTPGEAAYEASQCVPTPISEIASDLGASIETDEAKMESASVIAGFKYVTGKATADILPALIFLAGSTTCQFVYVPATGNKDAVTTTFALEGSTTSLIQEKLREVLPSAGKKAVNNLFFNSNFAFAIVNPAAETLAQQTADETPDGWPEAAALLNDYYTGSAEKYPFAAGKNKPSQSTQMTFKKIHDSVVKNPYTRKETVQDTLEGLLLTLKAGGYDSLPIYVFKELKKQTDEGEEVVKVGVAQGTAMAMAATVP